MTKTILITGATDGIGLETAKLLASFGYTILLHGRSAEKLNAAKQALMEISSADQVETYIADLSNIDEVIVLANNVIKNHKKLDVLINNAGVFKTSNPISVDRLDVRFVVNTIAPYILTQRLLPLMDQSARVINLSSAAQAPVNLEALNGKVQLNDMEAYAQSKLAITMWSQEMAQELINGPIVVAVNPGSLLASKMVKEGFGMAGNDLSIGAEILKRASVSDDFADASGLYFDNDSGRFATPHPDAMDHAKSKEVISAIKRISKNMTLK